MAKKFVEVIGLHNIFNADELQLNTSSLKEDVKAKANENSILFITADSTDITYGYTPDSRWIWTRGKLYNCNDTISKINEMIPITYSDLVELRNQSSLIPGQQYRIIDYVTTVAKYDEAWSAGHPFDVIVTADSNNKLNENARAIQREGEEYFKNSKLESWELKYCLDNDSIRFDWAADIATRENPIEKTGITTLPTSANWRSVTYGNGKFVAIAQSSTFAAYSTDGITWTRTTLPINSNWYSVTYGNGKFVAMTYKSTVAAYSEDGITWTQTTLPTSNYWQSATYGGGKFVAVAYNSNIATYSEDGITWTQTTLPTSTYWQSVTYGDGKFVAVAQNSNIAAYSEDGITWTQTTLPTSSLWRSVTYGNGKFVAVVYNFNIAAYSEDGITWTQTTLPTSTYWQSVTYGNGKFVAVAQNSNIATYSTDGITWTQTTLPTSAGWFSVTYGNGKFVTISYNSNIATYSTDGINWTREYTYTEYETITVPSKGVIYYLKDELGNEAGYDFKNVLYKRYKITDCPKHPDWVSTYHGMSGVDYETVDKNDYKWYYTFSLNTTEDTDDIRDGSLCMTEDGDIYKQNKISEYVPHDNSYKYRLNNIVFRQLNGNLDDCYSNTIENNCHNATIGMSWTSNTHVGCDCYNWTTGNVWSNWTIGSGCGNWTCGEGCEDCIVGNNCYNFHTGNGCNGWSIGYNCYNWTCGEGCTNWSIGNNVNNWSVGSNCYGWTCGNDVIDWRFGTDVYLQSYCSHITIDSGCQHFYIYSTETTSSATPITNIHVMNGVSGTSMTPLAINITDLAVDYTIEVNKNKKTITL